MKQVYFRVDLWIGQSAMKKQSKKGIIVENKHHSVTMVEKRELIGLLTKIAERIRREKQNDVSKSA